MQGNIGIVAQPPQWLWDGMAAFAPEVAELACEGVDVASAAAYFKVHLEMFISDALLFCCASLCVGKTVLEYLQQERELVGGGMQHRACVGEGMFFTV